MHVAIIGLGRVGLPLALFIESLGIRVTGIDRDQKILNAIREKRMPFQETGCDELMKVTKMQVSDSIAAAREAEYIIITVGTPLHAHIEADLNYLKMVVQDLVPVLKRGHVVLLRSTVAPETTLFLKQYSSVTPAGKSVRSSARFARSAWRKTTPPGAAAVAADHRRRGRL
jgi:UDP-N-acetyl-D-mannosaminuronic acid dehydrogenase